MEYTVGQVVYSKCGHDKGKTYIVTEIEEDFLYLTDGKSRKMDKPKKKKPKHLQITNYYDDQLKSKIENGEDLLDADFVKALKKYSDQKQSKAN